MKAKRTPSSLPEYLRSPGIAQSSHCSYSPGNFPSPEYARSPEYQHLLSPESQGCTTPENLRSGTPMSIRLGVQSVEEVTHLPDLERDVDIMVIGGHTVNQVLIYGQVRPPVENVHPLFALSASLRHKIYRYCFEVETDDSSLGEETRTITLSPRFATKAVFEDGFFASPWDVLESVMGALSAFRILRHDLLAYFWTHYRFHVTLSMFSGPKFSPLSHIWLPYFLDVIQYLTIEVDLTRLGGSAIKGATKFGHNIQRVENTLCDIIRGLSARGSSQGLAELKLLCRRYAGFRPLDEINIDSELPFVPQSDSTYIRSTISGLRGIVKQCRVAGFTQDYAEDLLQEMFWEEDEVKNFTYPDNGAWPPQRFRPITPRQRSNTYELQLLKSPSFAEEFEEIMKKWPVSLKSAGGSLAGESLRKDDDSVDTESSLSIMKRLNNVRRRCSSRSATTSRSVSTSSNIYHYSKLPDLSAFNIRFDKPSATPADSDSNADTTRLQTPTTKIQSSKTLTASPNTMNRLNEEDPAFQRTVNALRSSDLGDTPVTVKKVRPVSYAPAIPKLEQRESPGRAKTSLGTHVEKELSDRGMNMEQGVEKNRFSTFFAKLRRRPT